MSTSARRLLPLLFLSILVALTVACDAPMSTAVIAGSDNRLIWGPYTLIMWMAMITFVLVMALTAYLSIAYRERPGRVAQQIHGNTRLEILWTLIPVAIVVVMAVPTIDTIQKQAAVPADAMKVIAIGHQWWFEFQYPDNGGVITANELHIPEGKTVAFDVRSTDVIHAFWVPQLAGKIDMMPGHINKIHFSADKARPEPYLGQCAELCGYSHANMRFRVFVDTQADFDKWIANAKSDGKKPVSPLAAQGQEIFNRSACIGCHTINGGPAQAKIGPDLSHLGARTTIASGTLENNEANLQKWIHNSADIKPGSKMPPMGTSGGAGGTLSDDEIKAVAAYLLELK